ncbi:tetratricopeptide repeat protein [Nitrosophilus alvini]|uniref:tetratricopeptide repeat protein n=1 Tax=Nitrosophilus alvini TaxID=2714855 RepID=UPI00190B979F|nr:tetratricopeptide repeat protein [Nitrosophilus alvini]
MDNFLLEYRDPLFGIIIFFSLIFIISFFSYWWGIMKSKEEESELGRFLSKFEGNADKELWSPENLDDTKKALLLLASSFEKSGDFEKAIAIYLGILEKTVNKSEKHDVLRLLGRVYFKAGFLQRCKDIFIEILKFFPRDPWSLRYLMVTYERLRDYRKALEITESLEELEDVKEERGYLLARNIIEESSLSDTEKIRRLLALYADFPGHTRLIFEFIFKTRPNEGWKALKEEHYPIICDILWNLPYHSVDFGRVEKNRYLKELYSAKGYGNYADGSTVFEFDVLINLNKEEYGRAGLEFEYICRECKQIFPLPFNRCPNCMKTGSAEPEMLISEVINEKDISI